MISWLEKLGLGLKKSSQKIGGGISGIFTKRKLDAETLEELEELLIASDMGVRTAAAIVGEFSKMRQDKEISEQEIREKLAAELEKLLRPCERKFAVAEGKKPFVILMVGGKRRRKNHYHRQACDQTESAGAAGVFDCRRYLSRGGGRAAEGVGYAFRSAGFCR